MECPVCRGSGRRYSKAGHYRICITCRGKGEVEDESTRCATKIETYDRR